MRVDSARASAGVAGRVEGRDARLLVQPPQLDAHRVAQRGIEGAQRLVEQEQPRLERERARERGAQGLRAVELGGAPALEAGEPDALEGGRHLARERIAAHAPLAQPEGHVVAHRHVGPQRVAREHHADAALLRRHRVDGRVVHHDAAGVGPREAGEHAQERGLAAAGGAEQRVELAGQHGHGHVPQHPRAVEALPHPLHAHLGDTHHAPVAHTRTASAGPRPPKARSKHRHHRQPDRSQGHVHRPDGSDGEERRCDHRPQERGADPRRVDEADGGARRALGDGRHREREDGRDAEHLEESQDAEGPQLGRRRLGGEEERGGAEEPDDGAAVTHELAEAGREHRPQRRGEAGDEDDEAAHLERVVGRARPGAGAPAGGWR